ncbi:conserved unknown protein [Ectocarpus siliculosus]|uniref:VPS9 domain-containing protein n=1 Tax=Ectocarpus siliculosus TaxID=2880 RepID=D8LL30_ECTSI|nr:conserved unknown protein [Ectocarpus siliculosus]|eukprot:CBN79664.1 conserved unknown protein [Ectocarpus siliculosus]
MRRTRRSSFDTAGGDGGGGGLGFDQKRRTELLAEARRKRVAWVEEARGIDDGVDGARKRREDEAAASGRKAEGELERLFPSAVKFHDFLTGLAGDRDESPAGDMSAILQPFMIEDVDIGDDRPIPAYREGSVPFDVFLDKLRHPRAAEVVKSLQQFVAAFRARVEAPPALASPGPRGATAGSSNAFVGVPVPAVRNGREADTSPNGSAGATANNSGGGGGGGSGVTAVTMSGMMHAFLGRVEAQMRESALWRRETEAQWEDTRESLERIVMHKVFDQAYGLAADPGRDSSISTRLRSLGFLTEEHLGVPPLVDAQEDGALTWADAEAQLLKMSRMRCPGDMLRCIVKCTRIVAGLLTGDRAAGGALPGADDFLPALILLVKRANPPGLHSTLEFVQSFRDPSKLLSEAGYVLTQLVSAVCFLEEVDASVLSIAHGDFERGLIQGFQESARVGLQAHQQEVKKEEEHARLLHSNSQGRANGPIPGSATTSASLSPPPSGDHASAGTAAAVGGGGGGEASAGSPGPASLPQPEPPRTIGTAEVRTRRQAAAAAAGAATTSLPFSSTAVSAASLAAGGSGGTSGTGSSTRERHPSGRSRQRQQRNGGSKQQPAVLQQLRFVGCTAAELRMSEVPALLAEHDQLARLCERLLAEREEMTTPHRRR